MPKTITLNPRWKPAELPADTAPYGGDWFVPCVVDPAGAETHLSSDAGVAIGNQLVFDLRFAGHVLQAPRRRWHPRWARARRWMVEETNRVTLPPRHE